MPDSPRDAVQMLAEIITKLGTAIVPYDPIVPEGLAADGLAAFLSISKSALYDLDSRGLIPEGVVLGDGRIKRWVRSEIIAWLKAGAPSRARWAIIKNQSAKRAG